MDIKGDDREQGLRKLRELIEGIPTAALTTLDGDGHLHSRPMATHAMEAEGVLWFLTKDDSAKVHEVVVNAQVGLTFTAPDPPRYVSVSGRAELVRDRQQVERLWRPELKAWFPEGPKGTDLAALRVEIESAQYWDAPSGQLMSLGGFLRALRSGKKAEREPGAESAKVTAKTRIAPDTVT